MRTRVVTALLLLVCGTPGANAAQAGRPVDLTGAWTIELSMPSGPGVSSVTFKQQDSALAGEYSSSALGRHAFQGTVTGRAIEFSFKWVRPRGGQEETTVTLTGAIVSSDEIKGTITLIPGNAGTFTARRDTALSAAAAVSQWRDPSPHRVSMIAVDRDVALEVLDWGGSGRALVLLAGQGNTAHVYDEFVTRLLPLGHVYGITRRGYGRSSVPKQGYDADRLADDVMAVIDALKIERPVVIGHSVAGEELNSIGARYPLRTAGLVYLDSVGDRTLPMPPGYFEKLQSIAPSAPRPTEDDRRNIEAFQQFEQRTTGRILPESELRELFEVLPDGRVGRSRRLTDRAYLADVDQAVDEGVRRPDYSRFRVPALSIQSFPPASVAEARALNLYQERSGITDALMNDVMSEVRKVTSAQIDVFEQGVKGARNKYLLGADHFNFISNPEDVLREIRIFLDGLR
ncbi:MAG TPA: alpha/beta fold hydrolase [Vicinamibacterales bacterium]|jgi:pimeloyl-ACP methyl ester carboxylesterase|nr:alpha/beta fold hydrolase [Vicinamibacterales bacterium]